MTQQKPKASERPATVRAAATTDNGLRVPPREPAHVPRSYYSLEKRVRALTTAPIRRGLVATGAAGALAVAALVSPWLVAVVMVALQLWFTAGWMRLLGLPSQSAGGVVIMVSGVIAVGISLGTRDPKHLVLAIAAGLIAAFVVQMLRQDGRPRLVEDLSGIIGGAIAATCGAGWVIAAGHYPLFTFAAAVTISAVAAVAALPFYGRRVILISIPVGAVVSVLAGAVVVSLLMGMGLVEAPENPSGAWEPLMLALLGGGIGLVTTMLHVLLSWLPSSGRRRPAAAAALLPVLLIGVSLEFLAFALPA